MTETKSKLQCRGAAHGLLGLLAYWTSITPRKCKRRQMRVSRVITHMSERASVDDAPTFRTGR